MDQPQLQIKMFQDGKATEIWTYYPEENYWMDELGAMRLSSQECLEDVGYAVEHAISIIDGTHP